MYATSFDSAMKPSFATFTLLRPLDHANTPFKVLIKLMVHCTFD